MLFKTLNYIKYDYLRISTKIIIERIKDIPCQKMTGFLSIIAGFFLFKYIRTPGGKEVFDRVKLSTESVG